MYESRAYDIDRLTRERDTAMERADRLEARISEARALLRAGVAERAAILRALDTGGRAACYHGIPGDELCDPCQAADDAAEARRLAVVSGADPTPEIAP